MIDFEHDELLVTLLHEETAELPVHFAGLVHAEPLPQDACTYPCPVCVFTCTHCTMLFPL